MRQFYGKYSGRVVSNADPKQLGRLQVSVRDVLGDVRPWALPCVPYAGPRVGFFALPPVGAHVWVEFEGGNPELPIWTDCFWGPGEVPAAALAAGPAAAGVKVLQTDQVTITLTDRPSAKGVAIETQGGMKLVIDTSGIEIATGQGASIKLTGRSVRVNGNALEVN